MNNNEQNEMKESSIYGLLKNAKDNYSDRVAVRYVGQDDAVVVKTFKDFYTDIQKTTGWLYSQNIPVGSHVMILKQPDYNELCFLFASVMAGLVVIPANVTEANPELVKKLIATSDTQYIYTDDELLPMFQGSPLPILNPGDITQYEPVEIVDKSHPDELSFMYFTSGTTGFSKAVMHSQKSMMSASHGVTERFLGYKYFKDVLYLTTFFHVAGIIIPLVTIEYGCAVNCNFNPKFFYRDFQKMPSSSTIVPPIIYYMLIKVYKKDPAYIKGLHGVLVIGASCEPNSVISGLQLGFDVFPCYGMTESAGLVSQNLSKQLDKVNSAGTMNPGTEIKFIDGEICLKGDCVMMGYYKQPELTAKTMTEDGWLLTGDLGHLDREGYLIITGRKKNLIILASGENVSPLELENQISMSPMVNEVVVKEFDGKIAAYIFCECSYQAKIKEFIEEINHRNPAFKRISNVFFTNEPFPKTALGKIIR